MSTQRLRDISQGRNDIYKIDPLLITPTPGFNERAEWGDIEALATSIHESGNTLLQPIVVRKDGDLIQLIDGERRLKAINLLIAKGESIPTIHCRPEPAGWDEQKRLIAQLELNSGKPFSLLEKGRVYHRLTILGLTAADIARRTQTTKTAVGNALTLIRHGSDLILKSIATDSISATTALHIIQLHKEDPSAQDHILETASAIAQQDGKSTITTSHVDKVINPKIHALNVEIPSTLPTPAENDGYGFFFKETNLDDYGIDLDACTFSSPSTFSLIGIPKNSELLELTIHYAWVGDGVVAGFDAIGKETSSRIHLLTSSTTHPDLPHAIATQIWPAIESFLLRYIDETLCSPIKDALAAIIPFLTIDVAAAQSTAAIERIKNTPDTGTAHGGPGGPSSHGTTSIDKRFEKLSAALDDLNPDKTHQERLQTAELILDYLDGAHDLKVIKSHLHGK